MKFWQQAGRNLQPSGRGVPTLTETRAPISLGMIEKELTYTRKISSPFSGYVCFRRQVWKLVAAVRHRSCRKCTISNARSRPPAVILCNGDTCGEFGDHGREAVAALVDGGFESPDSPFCRSLSITCCTLGTTGAMTLAKALCRRSLSAAFLDGAVSPDNIEG